MFALLSNKVSCTLPTTNSWFTFLHAAHFIAMCFGWLYRFQWAGFLILYLGFLILRFAEAVSPIREADSPPKSSPGSGTSASSWSPLSTSQDLIGEIWGPSRHRTQSQDLAQQSRGRDDPWIYPDWRALYVKEHEARKGRTFKISESRSLQDLRYHEHKGEPNMGDPTKGERYSSIGTFKPADLKRLKNEARKWPVGRGRYGKAGPERWMDDFTGHIWGEKILWPHETLLKGTQWEVKKERAPRKRPTQERRQVGKRKRRPRQLEPGELPRRGSIRRENTRKEPLMKISDKQSHLTGQQGARKAQDSLKVAALSENRESSPETLAQWYSRQSKSGQLGPIEPRTPTERTGPTSDPDRHVSEALLEEMHRRRYDEFQHEMLGTRFTTPTGLKPTGLSASFVDPKSKDSSPEKQHSPSHQQPTQRGRATPPTQERTNKRPTPPTEQHSPEKRSSPPPQEGLPSQQHIGSFVWGQVPAPNVEHPLLSSVVESHSPNNDPPRSSSAKDRSHTPATGAARRDEGGEQKNDHS